MRLKTINNPCKLYSDSKGLYRLKSRFINGAWEQYKLYTIIFETKETNNE